MAAAIPAETDVPHDVEAGMQERSQFRKNSLSIDTDCISSIQSFETPSTVAPDSPTIAESDGICLVSGSRRVSWGLSLDSPTSCNDTSLEFRSLAETIEIKSSSVKCMHGDVNVILFDFDGTLTSVPGEESRGLCKQSDLLNRSSMLAPHLQALRHTGINLGIISKSNSATIQSAIQAAGLAHYFNGPMLAKVGGLGGKARAISELVRTGALDHFGVGGIRQVLLVDDDFFELEQALAEGVQSYPVPRGGLRDEDFYAIRERIDLCVQ